MVDFGGWAMPVSFSGVLDEHQRVRTGCGLFDVSHMGEVFVSGARAAEFLQYLTINDISKLAVGAGQYTAICNEDGGMIDDLIVYRTHESKYLLCVNASNIEKDFKWIEKKAGAFEAVEVCNESASWSQLAIQGPEAKTCLAKAFPKLTPQIENLSYMEIAEAEVDGQKLWIARTGYTGEVGFEVYLPNAAAEPFAAWFLQANEGAAAPIGLTGHLSQHQ